MEPLSKQLLAAADLDLARSQGQWIIIAELSKRFKKYHPDETVLATAACIEAEFAMLVDRIRTRQGSSRNQTSRSSRRITKMGQTNYYKPDDGEGNGTARVISSSIHSNYSSASIAHHSISAELYRHDTPEHISFLPRLDQSQATNVLQKLEALIQKYTRPEGQGPSTNDEWQAQLAKIVLARVYFEVGLYDKALGSLDKLALQMQQVHSGYGMVLLIQARVVKGTCLEMQNKISAAVDAYEAAWGVYEQHPLEKGQILWDWIEEALYRAILLQLRVQGRPRSVLRLMRGYMHLATSSWSSYWRMHKRWIVFEHYGYYLTKVVQEGTYPPMAISDTPYSKNTSGKSAKKASAFEELLCLTALCRSLYSSISSKLSPGEQAVYAEKFARLFVNAHDIIGWGPISNIRRVLQFLQLAREKTFNSLSISRYIFLTLARLGSFDEALLAFKSYMGLAGVPAIDELADSDIVVSDLVCQIRSKLRTLPDSSEDELDILGALIVGVKLYGRTKHDGSTAASIADVATELLQSLDLLSDQAGTTYSSIAIQTYRAHGSAYGLLASQCYDPETRAISNAKSIESLTRAADIENSEAAWRTYYELAVQQAQMKDTEQAICSIGQSLKLEPSHLPSWALLALLYSCQYRYRETLETIRVSLDNYYDPEMPHNVAHGLPAFGLFDGDEQGQHYFDKAEAYMRLRISQLLMLQQLEGPAAVSKLYGDLFIIYRSLAESLGMSQAHTTFPSSNKLKYKEPSEPARTKNENPARPKSTITNDSPIPLPVQGPPRIPDNQQTAPKGTRPRRKSAGFLDLRRLSSSSLASMNHNSGNATVTDSQHVTAKGRSRCTSLHDNSSNPPTDINIIAHSLTPPFSIPCHRPILAPLSANTLFLQNVRSRWHDILVELWVMSIDTYIKARRFEDASKALLEVEKLGLVNPKVWHQLGRFSSIKATGADDLRAAIDAYEKALMLDPDHVDTHIDMASTYIMMGEREAAEALLERTVHGAGWDRPQAWFLLGNMYKDQESYEQAKKCHLYAIELCDSIPLNSSSLSKLPRFI